MLITQALMKKAIAKTGYYSLAQIDLGIEMAGSSPWVKKLIGMEVPEAWWNNFIRAKSFLAVKNKQPQPKIINAMPAPNGWDWQPEKKDTPKIKLSFSGKKKNKKEKRIKITRSDNQTFYKSEEWLSLRVRVLQKYACKCMMCGRSPKDHGVVIHVDHIKPRSKYPELSLEFSNLQLLCSDCNIGKSNKYETDYRPDSDIEIPIVINAQKFI